MNKLISLLTIIIVSHSVAAQDKDVGGIKMPSKLTVDKTTLVLNGAGVREKYFIDLYVCGLYLESKSTDAKKIRYANEKMAIRLHIVSGMVTNKRMQDAVREGFKKSTNNNTASIKDKIEVMISAFSEQIKENDVYEIKYTPVGGSIIYKNGIQKAKIDGLAFKQALFGIWLGDNPAHKELREELMGE